MLNWLYFQVPVMLLKSDVNTINNWKVIDSLRVYENLAAVKVKPKQGWIIGSPSYQS